MLPSIQFIPCCRSAGRYRWMDFIEKVRINKSTTMADLELINQRFSRGTFSFHYISFWDSVLNVYSDVGVMMTHRLLVFVLAPVKLSGGCTYFNVTGSLSLSFSLGIRHLAWHWPAYDYLHAVSYGLGVNLTSRVLCYCTRTPITRTGRIFYCCYAFCYYKMGIVTAKGPSTIDHHLLV